MVIATQASTLSLPQINPGVNSVLDYLILTFPRIKADTWRQRVADGKVQWYDGTVIKAHSPYQAQRRVCYYREVEKEITIPFQESILFQNEHILLAYKPHFLPVTPGGVYINECLQNRLRKTTGLQSLQAVHRLDRATAGLVLFSIKPETRHVYHHLFASRQIDKTYQAIARIKPNDTLLGQQWEIKNRIIKSDPPFLMAVASGEPNSQSFVRCIAQSNDQALFELNPITGKTHQLRLHMQSIGHPIIGDNYYPSLQEKTADNYQKPLQLLAKKLQFNDPVTRSDRVFTAPNNLALIN